MKIIVLGAGLVGGPIAMDLARDGRFQVTAADVNSDALHRLAGKHPVRPLQADLSKPAKVKKLVGGFDLVVSAVPGFMGFETLRAVIAAGRHVVDIAFFIEDPTELDALAKRRGVIAIMDCGVAPGMCNLLIGYANHLLDATERVVYFVGGLPQVREWPYEYKAVFSPVDVIEEYIRPARFVENGVRVVKPALSDLERLDFPGVGTLEAFNTDGLRSLLHTIKAPNMKEKTLRYPGHVERIAMLRDTGFFSCEPLMVDGRPVRPMDVTARLLFPKWKLNEGEADLTVMKVVVEGRKGRKRLEYTWDLLDRYDPVTRVHSMARVSGFTATMALRMIADGVYRRAGLSFPEYLGRRPECVKRMLSGLEARGVVYRPAIREL